MFIDFLENIFLSNQSKEAIVWKEQPYTYANLVEQLRLWQEKLNQHNVQPGTVVMVQADYSPASIALFLALIEKQCIFVPITSSVAAQKKEFIEVSQVELVITIDESDNARFENTEISSAHTFYETLREEAVPGLVLFSSGSTGKSKAAVHDLAKLLDKFKVPRHAMRAISFLLYDHIGGVNTLLYTLSNAGCLITLENRQPDYVLRMVEKFAVELLPTSPSFINLMLISDAYKNYDISSLTTVTYGTEPMPESTLAQFHRLFPDIRLLQTYGLSELGIMRSKSKDSSSLWMKVGGEGFETRIVEGILHIKAYSAMLGYLNAPSPFTADGWFNTGDMVEQDGEYIKILGRESEIINVGGQKVFPAEVESVLQQLDEVAEAQVFGQENAILGNVVSAKIRLSNSVNDWDKSQAKKMLKKHCMGHLESFKIPAKFYFDDAEQFSARFKKQRTKVA
ncbi:long-chain fatty acid--CoA ligase [Alteromonas sediminis]|uniref:Long-chain fatty acid--CoA ligase n=1 Tax=Alteromonas sediminis TaxID=2259342 RepID=A0A3N5XW20_9ALTE|nr:fatty acid--CoA ligase family protein [Alteromonas sediminis]RPJ64977.1 long-chain fatty acid--CoA ligase [Alteromonas sediminis]